MAEPVWEAGTECVGKYNFPGSATHDLPFKRGDTLIIVSSSRDPNWYKARRLDGLEGMIPYNYVQLKKPSDRAQAATSSKPSPSKPQSPPIVDPDTHHQPKLAVKIQQMPWFHGNLSREDAEKLLRPFKNGQYIVRESQNYKGDYTLCVSYDHKVEHYRVRRNDAGRVTVDDEEYFDNLLKLVGHYQKDADGLCCRLKVSIDKTQGISVVVNKEDFEKTGWAIKKKDIVKKSMIGKGEFGEVWLGDYDGKKVAIKMLKDLKDDKSANQFITEAAVMTTLRHPNLVSMIGVSFDPPPVYLITEFMAKGSLVDYLRSRGRAVISKQNQLDFARHVCKGMVFLETKNFVHRDLAARNVLISEDSIAKVSDFGLTREVISKSEGTKLPVKWTSPEALRENKFSNKSDVWSFGILLWEVYSYGRVPYPRVPVEDVAQHVDKGYRMDSPDGCPENMYRIMHECWQKDPSLRPNFTRIERQVEAMTAT